VVARTKSRLEALPRLLDDRRFLAVLELLGEIVLSAMFAGASAVWRALRPSPAAAELPPVDRAVVSVRGVYSSWARRRGLLPAGDQKFEGAGLVFRTGLASARPAHPEIERLVERPLVEQPMRLRRASPCGPFSRAMAPVFEAGGELLERVVLAPKSVHLRFGVWVDPDVFDEVLAALDDVLREMDRARSRSAYRD
jgi:hypothetical protein